MNPISRYMHWLHTRWPAGQVEKLPVVNPDGSTAVPGLYVVGDITGVPLLKFSSDTGARAVQTIVADSGFKKRDTSAERDGRKVLDLIVIGAGVSGVAAAIEARKQGLSFELLEASQAFSTIVNFPKGKPIFTYPTDMTPAGELQFGEDSAVKEGLVDVLHGYLNEHDIEPKQIRAERIKRTGGLLEVVVPDGENMLAHRVVVGIGRSGNFRKLGVPGEDKDKVYNRLHDPKDYCGQQVVVVGGGDSAMETAIALGGCGCNVTLSYRKPEFSRPKPENVEKLKALSENPEAAGNAGVESPSSERVTTAAGDFMGKPEQAGSVTLMMSSHIKEVRDNEVVIEDRDGHEQTIENDAVFTMIGREAPLDFFRRSGVPVHGDRNAKWWAGLSAFFLFCFWLYHWKGEKPLFGMNGWNLPNWLNPDTRAWISGLQDTLGGWASSGSNPLGVLLNSAQGPSFWYTLAYSTIIIVFGIRRVRRRKTPYVKVQTLSLACIQVVPLFLLPELILPWLNGLGFFDTSFGGWLEQTLFPGESWWRAYGFILAWPLFIYNWFTEAPIYGWLVLGFIQTFVIIPLIVWRWGKGAYCGWICSCGALAETLGDQHRQKMPHGPVWNRLNMIGQVFLFAVLALMLLRVTGWVLGPGSWASKVFKAGSETFPILNYKWFVDLLWAGVIGYGLYFWFSGRVWCRFACPLAALMHIYARFSQFRIFSEKKKCISCNVCTSVCHQGIDVMNFANKGLPMEDPECVRCSACVQSCPTGVLSFGRINRKTGDVLGIDQLGASPVRMAELTIGGKSL